MFPLVLVEHVAAAFGLHQEGYVFTLPRLLVLREHFCLVFLEIGKKKRLTTAPAPFKHLPSIYPSMAFYPTGERLLVGRYVFARSLTPRLPGGVRCCSSLAASRCFSPPTLALAGTPTPPSPRAYKVVAHGTLSNKITPKNQRSLTIYIACRMLPFSRELIAKKIVGQCLAPNMRASRTIHRLPSASDPSCVAPPASSCGF